MEDNTPGRSPIAKEMFKLHKHSEDIQDTNPNTIVYTEADVIILLAKMRALALNFAISKGGDVVAIATGWIEPDLQIYFGEE